MAGGETSKEPKDFPKPENFGFILAEVHLEMVDEDNEPMTSCVLRPTETSATPKNPRNRPRGKVQNQALGILRNLETLLEPKPVLGDSSSFSLSANLVSVDEWRDACIDAGINRQTFYDLRKPLEKQGFITFIGGHVRSCSRSV